MSPSASLICHLAPWRVRTRVEADPSLAGATSEKGSALALAEAAGHTEVAALLRAATDQAATFVQACIDGDLAKPK